jgi:hypothetical protein
MDNYDPLRAPEARAWLALGEDERIALVEAYHRRARVRLPDAKVHAVVHVIVENQLAMELPVPAATLARLMHEGLDRHDALHAIAMVLVEHMNALMRDDAPEPAAGADVNAPYYEALARLTAAEWRAVGDEA